MPGSFVILYAFAAGMVLMSLAMSIADRGLTTPLARAYGAFAAGTAVWNLSYALMCLMPDEASALNVYRLGSLAWAANPSLALYYAGRLRESYAALPSRRWAALAPFVPLPLIWYGIFSGRLLTQGLERTRLGWIERIDPASPWNWIFLLGLCLTLGAFVHFGTELIRSAGTRRARMHAFMITVPVSVMVLILVITHIVLPLVGAQTVPPLVQVLLGLWLAVTGVLQHRYPVFSLSPEIAADAIIEGMSDACFLVDDAGLILGANPAVRELLGREPDGLRGRRYEDIFPPELHACFEADSSSRQRGCSLRATLLGADGKPIPCSVNVSSIRDSLGDQVGYAILVHELREEQRLKRLSETDALTGAANRRRMEEALALALSEPRRKTHALSLVIMDIDRFKDVNDRYGHDMGDAVLKDLASLIIRTLREADLFCRWGGEEFLILCPDTDEDEALVLADRVRTVVAAHRFAHAQALTLSLGAAEARPGEDAQSLVKRADQALYRAKVAGRNRAFKAPGPSAPISP